MISTRSNTRSSINSTGNYKNSSSVKYSESSSVTNNTSSSVNYNQSSSVKVEKPNTRNRGKAVDELTPTNKFRYSPTDFLHAGLGKKVKVEKDTTSQKKSKPKKVLPTLSYEKVTSKLFDDGYEYLDLYNGTNGSMSARERSKIFNDNLAKLCDDPELKKSTRIIFLWDGYGFESGNMVKRCNAADKLKGYDWICTFGKITQCFRFFENKYFRNEDLRRLDIRNQHTKSNPISGSWTVLVNKSPPDVILKRSSSSSESGKIKMTKIDNVVTPQTKIANEEENINCTANVSSKSMETINEPSVGPFLEDNNFISMDSILATQNNFKLPRYFDLTTDNIDDSNDSNNYNNTMIIIE